MKTLAERKLKYVKAIMDNHPIYIPEAVVSQRAKKNLLKLPEQVLFYLYHCKGGLK